MYLLECWGWMEYRLPEEATTWAMQVPSKLNPTSSCVMYCSHCPPKKPTTSCSWLTVLRTPPSSHQVPSLICSISNLLDIVVAETEVALLQDAVC